MTNEKAATGNPWIRNPYTAALTEAVTLQLPHASVAYFDGLARDMGISRVQVMELLLRNASAGQQRLDVAAPLEGSAGRKRA